MLCVSAALRAARRCAPSAVGFLQVAVFTLDRSTGSLAVARSGRLMSPMGRGLSAAEAIPEGSFDASTLEQPAKRGQRTAGIRGANPHAVFAGYSSTAASITFGRPR